MQTKPELLTCRAATPSDEPLLYEIFAADRAQELDALWLSAEQTAVLLELQFRARQAGYARDVPGAATMVVGLQDGTSVGYYYLARTADGYRLVDLAVLPHLRNCGVGGWILRQLQQRCAAEHISLSLRVRRGNPALSLYQRLGFSHISSDALSHEMIWAHTRPGAFARHASVRELLHMEQGLLMHADVTEYNLPEVVFAR